MAIAEPVLRNYIGTKFKIRGLSPIGIAIGAGIGIGTYLFQNVELFWPGGGNILNPPGSGKPGVQYLNEAQSESGSNQLNQTFRTRIKYRSYKRRKKNYNRSKLCCCTCKC